MTQQYLAGELSLLIAQLAGIAPGRAAADAHRLRLEAESWPLGALPSVAIRALALADELCWDALSRGEAEAFGRRARLAADLYEFGVCADLLGERDHIPGDQLRGADNG